MRATFALCLTASASLLATHSSLAQTKDVQQQGHNVAAKADPDGKRALPVADYARWRTITTPTISPDGKWVAWVYTQVRHDDELHVRQADSDKETVIDGGSRPRFSDDGQWVAYFVAPPTASAAGRGRGGRGGAAAGRGVDANAGPQTRRAELMNLATGTKATWDDAANFEFSKGAAFFAVHRAKPQPAPKSEGTDLIVRDLKAGTDRLIGSVSDFAFNKPGTILAYTIDANEDVGNGLYMVDLNAGVDRVLENAREHYGRLTWSEDGTALAALHGKDVDSLVQRDNSIIAVTGLASGNTSMHRVQIAPGSHGLPANTVVSEKGALTWSEKNDRLFFGTKSQDEKHKVPTEDDLVAASDVDIFHVNDDRIQTVQRAQANADRNRTDRAALDIASQKVTRVSDSTTRQVLVTKDGKWAVVGDDRAYVSDYQQARADYYRVNVATGERTPILTKQGRTFGLTPDSKYFLYWKDKQVWSYDLAANKHTNITAKAPVSFVNAEDDHFGEKPAYGIAGFSKDGKSVILEHRYDLWEVPLDGTGTPTNITKGAGSAKEIRLRYIATDADTPAPAPGAGGGRGRGGAPEVTIDLSKPVLLSAYGDLTKKSGYYELKDGQVQPLVFEDKSFGRPQKAANANRFLFTREDWSEYPDLRVSDNSFTNSNKLTNANPQQAEYRWGKRILFDFQDKDGHKLQGTLAIPDGYQPGTRLP
ncbi:MAG TPA: hypothetical protein VGM50_05075, partial [Gemmatimonadaceae bacterium]